MKLIVETKILKEILKLAKPIVSKVQHKEELKHILLECTDNVLTVVALDSCTALVKKYECVSEENGRALLPLFGLPGNLSEIVDIQTETENTVSVDFGQTKIVFTTPSAEKYFKYESIFPDETPEYEIYFDPQLLAKICKDAGKAAKFCFYGKLAPCIIEACGERRIILPKRGLPNEQN